MKKKTKISIIGLALFSIILLEMFSTITLANGNYNIALTKGTEVFTVSQYDEVAWKNTVNSSTTPSNWFEGESNHSGAKSKYTIKGWNYVSWESYDIFVSFFLPALFKSEELIPLLGLLNSQGYNETTINTNYTNSYKLWFGLSAMWNYTIGSFEENPSEANNPLLIFKNPSDFNEILYNYNNLSAELNNLPAIQFSPYKFPILEPDEFLWLFIFNGLTLGTPISSYLEELITTLDCNNATVSDNVLVINRTGETDYIVEITYSPEGKISSFVVKDIGSIIIFKIVATNSDWIFSIAVIITVSFIGGLSVYLIIRRRKIIKIRKK